MRKNIVVICSLIFVLSAFSLSGIAQAHSLSRLPDYSSASELISALNALRASYGLAPYQTNSILMSIAQTQAEYLVSIGTFTHMDAQGRSPIQRAVAAGYLVAGGYFAENVSGGSGQTANDAVQSWTGDDPHKNTMLSGTLQDVGAGVAFDGNMYYYVLDAGLSTGGTPSANNPPAPLQPGSPTIVPNTPNADGSIIHIIQPGQYISSLSEAYDVLQEEILKLNNLTSKSTIYVGQKIIIRAADTPTPTQPTSTPTIPPTSTPWSTSTPTSTATPIPPTSTPSPGLPVSAAGGTVAVIIATALLLAGLVVAVGRRRK
jgi:LysM repeat protein